MNPRAIQSTERVALAELTSRGVIAKHSEGKLEVDFGEALSPDFVRRTVEENHLDHSPGGLVRRERTLNVHKPGERTAVLAKILFEGGTGSIVGAQIEPEHVLGPHGRDIINILKILQRK